jgi:N-acetyl-beta-hexosaminidase
MADCINFNPFTPALNPLPNSTYEFVENLFREMTGVFKDDFIHVGGDERTCAGRQAGSGGQEGVWWR